MIYEYTIQELSNQSCQLKYVVHYQLLLKMLVQSSRCSIPSVLNGQVVYGTDLYD